MANRETLKIENARLMFKNFSGKASQFNREGNRNFAVRISDPETADTMKKDGWNVKALKPREEGDEPTYYITVNVNFNAFPPNIYRIAGKMKTLLNEETVGIIDRDEIVCADLIISPYRWEIGTNSGIKGYLKAAYITVEEDEFASKYGIYDDFTNDEEVPF